MGIQYDIIDFLRVLLLKNLNELVAKIMAVILVVFFSTLISLNPIRSGVFQTANDPGGEFKSPPPPPPLRSRKL